MALWLRSVDRGKRVRGEYGDRMVNLPPDYMIERGIYADAPSGPASVYYNAGVAHCAKELGKAEITLPMKEG